MADDATTIINQLLAEYGLDGLTDWAWEQIVNGANAAQVYQALRERPEWQTRYAAILEREARGLPPISEAELIGLERQAAQMMAQAGMPPGFYDHYTDFIPLFGTHDKGIAEINSNLANAFGRVYEAPEEVREAFSEMYGASGDAALAAFFLDPDKAAPVLERQARAAEVAGYGKRFGMEVGKSRAEDIADFNLSSAEVRQGVAKAAQQSPLFAERIGEDTDLTSEGAGLDAALNIGDSEPVRRRLEEREASMSGAGGVTQNQGRSGVGRSER